MSKSMSFNSFRTASTNSLASEGENSTTVSNNGDLHRTASVRESGALKSKVMVEFADFGNLQYGVAQAVGKKDQDRFDIRLAGENSEDVHYFGVFDGHGTSASAADLCVERLYDEIGSAFKGGNASDSDSNATDEDTLSAGSSLRSEHEPFPLPSDEAITKGFVKIDDLVQANRHNDPRAGTCAVALMIEQEEPVNSIDQAESDFLRGKIAWCGDSRAILIDSNNECTELTLDHRPDCNPEEVDRILNADHTPRPGLLESELWKREQEKAANSAEGARRLRAHSFIGRRQLNGHPSGPQVVYGHTGGISLQVTRSIGDAYGPRSVIPDPEIAELEVPRGEFCRFVLASDGVFEVLSAADVTKFVNRIAHPGKAAKNLAVHAKQKRLYGGHAADDITVIVVDMNPDARKTKNRRFFK